MAETLIADIERLVDDLVLERRIPVAWLSILSELNRHRRQVLADRWIEIPAGARESLVDEVATLAEVQLDLNFDEFHRVALGDPEPAIRVKAIASLWESGSTAVAEDLVIALKTDTEEAVRAAAAAGLESFVLAREFEDLDAVTGDRVVDALRAVVEDRGEPVNVRGAALEAVAGRALPWVPTLIKDAYYDDDRDLRLAALRAMGKSADTRWLEMLEGDLQSSDADVRLEAATAVGEIGEEDAVELAAPLLDDENRDVVIATLHALGNIAGPEASGLLRRFTAETTDEEFREHALVAQDVAALLNDESDEEGEAWDE